MTTTKLYYLSINDSMNSIFCVGQVGAFPEPGDVM